MTTTVTEDWQTWRFSPVHEHRIFYHGMKAFEMVQEMLGSNTRVRSSAGEQRPCKAKVESSNLSGSTKFNGPVAQLGAHLNGIEGVGGSIPPRSTIYNVQATRHGVQLLDLRI